jgi:hypothetical protein
VQRLHDEPFARELGERLARRPAGDVRALGQLGVAQRRARRQRPRKQLVPEQVREHRAR